MPEALVLGGGGVAGIAWITGLLAGYRRGSGRDSSADVIVGTSAALTVAAQLGGRLGLEELYAHQTEPKLQTPEIMVDVDLESFRDQIAAVVRNATAVQEMRRAVGNWALDAATVAGAGTLRGDRVAAAFARVARPFEDRRGGCRERGAAGLRQ
jgi:NTE family protein